MISGVANAQRPAVPAARIVIYGGGQIGVGLCRRLMRSGVQVCAIIDRTPEGVANAPVPVMNAQACFQAHGNTGVFVAIGNGLAHPAIARDLCRVGYTNILHLPVFLRGQRAAAMTRAWNAYYSGDTSVTFVGYDDLNSLRAQDFVLSESSGYITAVVHKDDVFTVKRSYPELDHDYADYFKWQDQGADVIDKATNVPIGDPAVKAMLPCEQVFTQEQLDFYHAKTFFDLGDYYREAASVALFDPHLHRFNILDGSHRAFYLERQGFDGIPLKMKRSEWEAYFKEPEAQALMDHCRGLASLPTVVKHPAFMSFPVREQAPTAAFSGLLRSVRPS
ncbi:hypothetical protein [Pseudomonas fulva]|uniref:hypothetical protein n=1 Tax=Pseudomonas fulva TaxID=47880 RepID=UPI0018AA7B1E|nr:hypothetical protein [Pseudomonas fulva]MBF8775880.1 hypothetical protein [Pseudomonas fulva]